MSFRGTWILLLVFVVLGAAVWWLEFREPPRPADTGARPVFDLDATDVTRIEVTHSGTSVAAELVAPGVWRLVKPEATDADGRRVDDVVQRVTSASASRVIDSPGDLATYGLADPALSVALQMSAGEPVELRLGDRTPDGASTYAMRPAVDSVYLIPSYVASDLTRFVTDPPKPRPTATPAPTLVPPAGGLPALPSPGATPSPAR